jgi:hypothetical protein
VTPDRGNRVEGKRSARVCLAKPGVAIEPITKGDLDGKRSLDETHSVMRRARTRQIEIASYGR